MAPWRYFLISCCDFTSKYCIFHCHNYLQFIIMTIIIVIIISIIIIIIIFWSLRLVSLRNERIHQFSDLYLHISWMAPPFLIFKGITKSRVPKIHFGPQIFTGVSYEPKVNAGEQHYHPFDPNVIST